MSVSNPVADIEKRHDKLKQNIGQAHVEKSLLTQVSLWEKDSIGKIQTAAKKIRTEIQHYIKESNNQINSSLNKIATEIRAKKRTTKYTESDIERLNSLLEACGEQWKRQTELNLLKSDLSLAQLIKIGQPAAVEPELPRSVTFQQILTSPPRARFSLPPEIDFIADRKAREAEPDTPPSKSTSASKKKERPSQVAPISHSNHDPYSSIYFNVDASIDKYIQQLFDRLGSMAAMDKNGPMSGDCDKETTQMETFLSHNFQFKNLNGEYIVHGVQSFRLGKPPHSITPNMMIKFPVNGRVPFEMTIQEIVDWQRSYVVYADQDALGMTKNFLRSALQGLSKSGDEAFRMKFVVRISKCPVLMEFNARIIPRDLKHDWPHRIKLVSVTGVDFAGRIHDINDITNYVANWVDIYELDPRTAMPLVYNGRDFRVKPRAPPGRLHEKTLLRDLMCMARLRLFACDREKVEVVVETGIGLGVFAGKSIGVDTRVRQISALAMRKVLEEDGASFENIRAVVFALPVFDSEAPDGRRNDAFQAFADEFEKKKYEGCVPVLVADQDMHRLTVAIAMAGYRVSELNPADSHGVFGEYWQNRGPAVEEKLALTTVGLLVQHHLINPHVLDMDRYHLVSVRVGDNDLENN